MQYLSSFSIKKNSNKHKHSDNFLYVEKCKPSNGYRIRENNLLRRAVYFNLFNPASESRKFLTSAYYIFKSQYNFKRLLKRTKIARKAKKKIRRCNPFLFTCAIRQWKNLHYSKMNSKYLVNQLIIGCHDLSVNYTSHYRIKLQQVNYPFFFLLYLIVL